VRLQGKNAGHVPGAGDLETQRNELAERPFNRKRKRDANVEVAPCDVVIGVYVVLEIVEGGKAAGIGSRIIGVSHGGHEAVVAVDGQLVTRPAAGTNR